MLGQELSKLQAAFTRQADSIQRDFIRVTEDLKVVNRRFFEASEKEQQAIRAEMDALHEQQAMLAEVVNVWRDRARQVMRHANPDSLRAYLKELLTQSDGETHENIERVLLVLDTPEEELERLTALMPKPPSPVDRLMRRALDDSDLRGRDPRPREAAAVEFANRPNLLNDDALLAELEAAYDQDPDPIARELAVLTMIQIYRARATRVAELGTGHDAIHRLKGLRHRAAIPVLIEVLTGPRTGFVTGEGGATIESNNDRTRLVALGRLVEWHTPEAQQAIRRCKFDQNPKIVQLAAQALELFPGEWKGPTPETQAPPPEPAPTQPPAPPPPANNN